MDPLVKPKTKWNGKTITKKVRETERSNIKKLINESSCAVPFEVLPVVNQNFAKAYNESAQLLFKSIKRNAPQAIVKSMSYNERNGSWRITFSNPETDSKTQR